MSNLPAKVKDRDEYGEAMAKLAPIERIFICMLFEGLKPTDALRKAGYDAPSDEALRKQASRLMHRPAIGDALLEECKRRKKDQLPTLDKALAAIISDTHSKDHFKAIRLGYQQAGLVEVQERNVNVSIGPSQKEKLDSIKIWAAELGLDPAKLLGSITDVETIDAIEAEFTEVPQPDLSKPGAW